MPKIKPWAKRAQKAAIERGVAKLAEQVDYARPHISQCIHGKRKTTLFLAIALSRELGIPVTSFGQKREKA